MVIIAVIMAIYGKHYGNHHGNYHDNHSNHHGNYNAEQLLFSCQFSKVSSCQVVKFDSWHCTEI